MKWRVNVVWPGQEKAVESAVENTDVQITDGGVLRIYRDGTVVAVYGPGFWVAAEPVAEDGAAQGVSGPPAAGEGLGGVPGGGAGSGDAGEALKGSAG